MNRRGVIYGILCAIPAFVTGAAVQGDGFHPDTTLQITKVRQKRDETGLTLMLLLQNQLDEVIEIGGLYSSVGTVQGDAFPQRLSHNGAQMVQVTLDLPRDAPTEFSLTFDLGQANFQSIIIKQNENF